MTLAAERRFRRTCYDVDKHAWSVGRRELRALYELLDETRIDDAGAHTADEFAAFFIG